MRNIVPTLTFLVCIICSTYCQPTILSYIAQIDKEEGKDFVQVTISTSAQDTSLGQAILQSRNKAQALKEFAQNTCKNLVKNTKICKDFAQIGKVQVKPHYKTVKKDTFYQKMSSTYSVTIKLKQMKDFAVIIDEILKIEGIKVEKIQWKADQDLQEANILEQSLEKSDELCSAIGKQYKKLIGVQQLREKPEEPEEKKEPEEGEQEQEQEQQEQKPEQQEEKKTKYRITIECDKKETKKKKKGK